MRYHLLLVDDDSDDRSLFSSAAEIASERITCTTLSNGNVLLQTIAESAAVPDVIFLDVNMPMISGWKCLAHLKGHPGLKDIPVIMYSTSKHDEEIALAKESGALCFFTKPDDFTDLINAIGDVATHLENNTLSMLPVNSKVFF